MGLDNEINLEKLIEIAKERIASGDDQKFYVSMLEMMELCRQDGARILTARPQMGGSYITEVMYQGVIFVHITSEPFLFRREVYQHYVGLGSSIIH